ncbi:MAG: response regulator [Asticcacaulis sp.]
MSDKGLSNGFTNLFRSARGKTTKGDYGILAALVFVAAFFVGAGFITYSNISTLRQAGDQVSHSHEVINGLTELMSSLKDAETGQRGYIITGDDTYLIPYENATMLISERRKVLSEIEREFPEMRIHVTTVNQRIDMKLAELKRTLDVRRTQGLQAAAIEVARHLGKNHMDTIRAEVRELQTIETARREERVKQRLEAFRAAQITSIVTAILGVLVTLIIAAIIRRASQTQHLQVWLQSGEVGLGLAMAGEQSHEELGRNLLSFLCEYTGAHAGAFFVRDGDVVKQAATFGVPADSGVPSSVHLNEGLIGQAAADGKLVVLSDLPDPQVRVGAALGEWAPRHLIVAPATFENQAEAVIELGFLKPVDSSTLDLMQRISEGVSIAVRSANYRIHLQNLLEETQRQSEELQSQSEELRVNNEELEEQSRALKESHLRLEQQQAELEQTNIQLSEQTRMLELQKDDLDRSEKDIRAKAHELEQASRYKSDFLANMSHELRTPLNSSLILAKLLADNRDGNLSDEQVKFARTIQSSGNDLLALINDILDLSKIEAGHMEISAEPVSFRRLSTDLGRIFDPMAKERSLEFKVTMADNLPDRFDSDRQRLEQVLKNLLSNALKFTEKGSVTLHMDEHNGKVRFAVTDTGIGISAEQQRSIFEAFRQADSTISRKYGGTGLGLSISRELSRLLGGHIELKSTPGKGSTFTLILPMVYDPAQVASRTLPMLPAADAPVIDTLTESAGPESAADDSAPIHVPRRPRVNDDRDRLSADKRVLLAVEDDPAFATILYELAQDLGFQCLIADNAEDAMVMVRQYNPAAVVLDVGLPDHSGLSVLDRLKRDPRTRHIPVHVVSGNDYMHTALAMGAAGYMLKPVQREKLVDAFTQLETRLEKRMRRVLIVEDDAVQRDSVMALLKTQDVETVAVGTAAECLTELKQQTYDCMVLDLNLPDATGYSLLETLSSEQDYAFPPVIVYTGRDISPVDEQRLRRYSKSIIIKGAKSPERLLDEVTLFLHQMVSEMTPEQQTMLSKAKGRDNMLEGRRLLVVEDDVRNIYAVTNIFEPLGAIVQIARNGREALDALNVSQASPDTAVDLVLMDVMMPEMDGLTATREIRKHPEWKKLPIIMLTAKAMKDDQQRCLDAGANDYMAKPLDVEKLVSLVRVWVPR